VTDSGGVSVAAVSPGTAVMVATDPKTGVKSSTSSGIVTVTRKAQLVSMRIVLAAPAVRVGGRAGVIALGTFDDGTTDVDVTASVDWTSVDGRIADVVATPAGSAEVVGVAPGFVKIKARNRDTGLKAESPQKITVVGNLASLVVSPAKRTIRLGTRSRLTAIGTFERGVTVDLSKDVQWSSSDSSVASVDAQGRVQGLRPGRATVSAVDPGTGIQSSTSGGDSAISIVGALLSIDVTPGVLALGMLDVGALRASGRFLDEVASVNLTGKVEWVVSDLTVVSVTPAGGVSCLAPGSAFVSAVDPTTRISSTSSNGDAQVLCAIPIAGIAVFPDRLQLKVDKSKKVKAFLTYENGTQIDITKRVTWDSTNKFVATIDTKEPDIGRVHGQSPGQATVFVSDPVTQLTSNGPGGTSLQVVVVGP